MAEARCKGRSSEAIVRPARARRRAGSGAVGSPG